MKRAQLTNVFENLDHTADGFIQREDIRMALNKLDIVASDAQITCVMCPILLSLLLPLCLSAFAASCVVAAQY